MKSSTKQAASAAAALFMGIALSGTSNATIIATISGGYGDLSYDTPDLIFNIPTGLTIQNANEVLYAYQSGTDNYGISQSNSLGTLSGTVQQIWNGSLTPGNLLAGDYDDEYVGTSKIISPATSPCCVAGGGPQYFALVGNFSVTFTGNVYGNGYTGQLVSSYFTPAYNYTGGFVGWEGLDPSGYSESSYDTHGAPITGTLAVISLGPPIIPGTPEPSTWAMMLLGFAGLGLAGYRASLKSVSISA